jgi:hypothetical protein
MRITRHGFVRCEGCGTHVKLGESCPTCSPAQRVSRGGAIAASLVAFSAVASACGSNEPQTEPGPNEPDPVTQMDEPVDDPTAVDVYGIPPEEEQTVQPDPTAAPAYGIAPPEEPPETGM